MVNTKYKSKNIRKRNPKELKRIGILELQKIKEQNENIIEKCYIPSYNQRTHGAIPICKIQPFTNRRCPPCAQHPILPNKRKMCYDHFPSSPSCENCQFTKSKSKLRTISEIFQAKVTAEVNFLKTLPEDDKQRKILLKLKSNIIKERNAKEREYSGPPLLTDSDKQKEEKRQRELTKKFNRESAQRSKIKLAAKREYLKEMAYLNTKKVKNIKFITEKKVNLQLKEDIAKMTQNINELQKTLDDNIKKYQSADEELLLHIVLNNDSYSNNSSDNNAFSSLTSQPSTHNEDNIGNFQEPPTNIATNQEFYEIDPQTADSYNAPDNINDLIPDELYNMDIFDSIDMDDNIQDINNIGTIMQDINELIPIIPSDTPLIEEGQAFKEIEEAVTINHLRSSTHEDSEGYINQTPVMDDLFNSAPISPPNQFKNNYEP